MVSKNFINLIQFLPLAILTSLIKIYFATKKLRSFFRKKNRILDDKGVPYIQYGFVDGIYIGKQRNPVTISQEAINHYEKFSKTKDEKLKRLVINNADWLVENSIEKNDYAILEYNFPFPVYDFKKPWKSAMAQGQAIQALIFTHKITQNEKYLKSAKKLLNSFFVEVENGGVTYKDSEHEWWYEEYASETGKIPRVLNGMIFALLGIYDFFQYTNDKNAMYLFEQGIRSLKKNLSKFDFNDGYSYYDLLGRPARKYHKVHLDLLKKLFEITNEKIFYKYYEKWKDFDFLKHQSELVARDIKNLN